MGTIVLRGGRVLDPPTHLGEVADVLVVDGVIAGIGPQLAVPEGAEVRDVDGAYVSAGFIDAHAHLFGAIGFASTDPSGVDAGVTTICDAGGAGIETFADFASQVVGRERTDVCSWLYLGPAGIATSFLATEEKVDIRVVLPDLDLGAHIDLVERHRPLIAGVKVPAFGQAGLPGPMTLAKGLASIMELPLYVHVGDLQAVAGEESTPPSLDVLGEGDVITHCYTPNPGGLFDRAGDLLPEVRAALDRGVVLDLGFGAFNFDFDVAERGMAQGILPRTISSDLQQINVLGPTRSLTHVMSMFLALGMALDDVVARVTTEAAALLRLPPDLATLAVGSVADITVFDVVAGELELQDTNGGTRTGDQEIRPRLTIKGGAVCLPDPTTATELSNWSVRSVLAEREAPAASKAFTAEERSFLADLAEQLEGLEGWDGRPLHRTVVAAMDRSDLDRGHAGRVVLASFLERVFPQAPGYFLAGLDRGLVQERLRDVSGR